MATCNYTIPELRKLISEKIPKGLIVPAHDDFGHHYKHVPTGQVFDSVTTKMQGVVDNPHLKLWAARLAVEHVVTSVISNPELLQPGKVVGLKDAAVMIHRDKFEDAGGIGTVGHKAVEEFNDEWIETDKKPESYDKFLQNKDARETAILRSALAFYRDFYYIPVASELLVCNLKDSYAGTLDCLGYIIVPEKKCTHENGLHEFSWQTSGKDWTKRECSHCGLKGRYKLALIDYKTSNSIKKKPVYCAQVAAYSKAFTLMTGIKPTLHIIVRLDKNQEKYEAVYIKNITEAYKNFNLMQTLSPWLNPKLEHTEPIIKQEIITI